MMFHISFNASQKTADWHQGSVFLVVFTVEFAFKFNVATLIVILPGFALVNAAQLVKINII